MKKKKIKLKQADRCDGCLHLYSDPQQHMSFCYYPVIVKSLASILQNNYFMVLKIDYTGGKNGHYYTQRPIDCPLSFDEYEVGK